MNALLLAVSLAVAAPDRSAPPPVDPSPALVLPAMEVDSVREGVRLLWLPVEDVRRVELRLVFRTGALPLNGGYGPLDELYDAVAPMAGRGMPPAKLDGLLALHDVGVSASMGLSRTTWSISVPGESLDVGLDALRRLVSAPTFPGVEVRREVDDSVRWLLSEAPYSPRAVGWYASTHAWYAPTDPRDVRPDLEALRKARPGTLKKLHARVLDAPLDVLVVGDVDRDALRPKLLALVDGLGGAGEPAPEPPARPAGTPKVLAVDVPGQDQAVVVVRRPAPPRDHADAPAFAAVQHAIGGHFLSRLNANLREDKGLTYGGYSTWNAEPSEGSWNFRVLVKQDDVGTALDEIDAEVSRMAEGGLTADELATFHTSVVADWNTTLQTAGSAAGRYGGLVAHDEPIDRGRARIDAQLGATLDDTRRAAAWLGGDEVLIVIVGDREVVEPQLAARHADTLWYEPTHAVLGRLAPRSAE